jgi:hypothetical protein
MEAIEELKVATGWMDWWPDANLKQCGSPALPES